jgi:predicted RNase H-like HicB family nuclease
MLIQWSDEDRAFIVTLPEFDDAKTHGDTYADAVKQGKELIESFFIWYAQDGKPLPEPRLFDDLDEEVQKKPAPTGNR